MNFFSAPQSASSASASTISPYSTNYLDYFRSGNVSDISARRDHVLQTSHPLILHQALAPLVLLYLTLLFFPHRTFLRNAIVVPPIFLTCVNHLLTTTSRHWGLAFCVGAFSFFGMLLTFGYLIAIDIGTHPKAIRIVNGKSYSADQILKCSLWERIKWTFSLIISSRGVGWGFLPRGHAIPPRPSRDVTRLSFITTCLVKLFVMFIVLDLYGLMLHFDPYFNTPSCWSTPVDGFYRTLDMHKCYPQVLVPYFESEPAIHFVYHTFRKMTTMLGVHAILSGMYVNAALWCTALCITPPESWPDFFGSVEYIVTLKGFWGYFWHQSFRQHFSYPGIYLSEQVLGLDKKSVMGQIIKVYLAFVCSGLLHMSGTWTQAQVGASTMTFFLLQPIGMAVEIVLKKMGAGKLVGFAWTFGFLLWSSEFFFLDFLKSGIGRVEPVPVSVWRLLRGEEFWRWGSLSDLISWDSSAFGWGLSI